MANTSTELYGPLKLGHRYKWEKGDTLSLVALKYCRHPDEYKDLEVVNMKLIYTRRFRLQVGDELKIPEHWLPLQNLVEFDVVSPAHKQSEPESFIIKQRELMRQGIIEDV